MTVAQLSLEPGLILPAEGQIEPKLEQRLRFLPFGFSRLDLNLLYRGHGRRSRCRQRRARRRCGDFGDSHLYDSNFFYDGSLFDEGSFALSGR